MNTFIYIDMKPYGTLKVSSSYRDIIKDKVLYLFRRGLNSQMIKGYLLAQGHSLEEINRRL